MLVYIGLGTNMAAGNQQNRLSLSFAMKGTLKHERIPFSNSRTIQIGKSPKISHCLSHRR